MAETSLGLIDELEELVRDQVRALKNSPDMNDQEILEYHLRHYRIMELYRQLDRSVTVPKKGWLA